MQRRTVLGVLSAIVVAFATLPSAVHAQGKPGTDITIPVTGTGPDAVFTGMLDLQRFVRFEDQILAVGTITGTLTDTTTGVTRTRTVVRQVELPVPIDPAAVQLAQIEPAQIEATCELLNLVLGPLDLNLLGLAVHLDQVVLNIEAQPGSGNLLGNLLCAVAGLLDTGGAVQQIVNALNSILAILG